MKNYICIIIAFSILIGVYNTGCGKTVGVGDVITFGHFEQDNDERNGAEPIKWRIIDKDADGHILVISEKVLLASKFNFRLRKGVTYANSTIRTYLNGYDASFNAENLYFTDAFIDEAFTDVEREKIITSNLPPHNNPRFPESPSVPAVSDKIFLLSISEAEQYLTDEIARGGEATRFAIKHGAMVNGSETGKFSKDGTCDEIRCYAGWWLRTPGGGEIVTSFMGVNGGRGRLPTGGELSYQGALPDLRHGVRPAMWLDYN